MKIEFAPTLLVLIAPCVLAIAHAGEPLGPKLANSKIESVILYRGQAQVTRTFAVEGDPGKVELILSDLPEQIIPDSLFSEPGEGLAVRAVRYRTRAVGVEP